MLLIIRISLDDNFLDALPFLALSCILSLCVPKNRWSGFTHSFTSHLWHTHNPLGISPLKYLYENLCDNTTFLPSPNVPYPHCIFAPIQIQQDSVLLILGKNLSIGFFTFVMSLLFNCTLKIQKGLMRTNSRRPFLI